jgi:ribonuclease HI
MNGTDSTSTRVFTDGACLGNPGKGGWGFAADGGLWASGYEAASTNQRMELTAAFEAVRRIPGPIEIVSDSTYVVNCFVKEWWKAWIQRGWKNSKKEPVANRDLWEPFIELVRRRGDVNFTWVKGHSGDRMNDAADKLATTAASEQKARSGPRFSDDVVADLEPDRPRSRGVLLLDDERPTQDMAADGPLVVITGHRPTELGGWDLANPVADGLRRQLTEILRAKKQVDPNVSVATGLGLGAEMLAAEASLMAAVPYIAVLAFEGIESRWPERTQRRFRELRSDAAKVEVLGGVPEGAEGFAKSMRSRDNWLAKHGTEAVVIWNRLDKIIGSQHDRLDRAFEGNVWVIEPPSS